MKSRRFLLASPLARLILRERAGQHIVEGYFPEHNDRSSYVSLDRQSARLILTLNTSGVLVGEPVEIPLAQAEALLEVTTGGVEYLQAALMLDYAEVSILQFITPGPLEVIDVAFEHEQDAREFQPPAWFGPEVSTVQRYHNRSLALNELTMPPEVPLTDEALNSLLDTLEARPAKPGRHRRSGAPDRLTHAR